VATAMLRRVREQVCFVNAKFAEFPFRDCPKRGPREASKADSDVMRGSVRVSV
jgi:hypothetical protein